jgi:hypothetical protein
MQHQPSDVSVMQHIEERVSQEHQSEKYER